MLNLKRLNINHTSSSLEVLPVSIKLVYPVSRRKNMMIVWITLCLLLQIKITDQSKENCGADVCRTADCVIAAADMLKNMNTSVDPCEDFYQYACGNYQKSNVIPEDKSFKGTFVDLDEVVAIKLKDLLEQPSNNEEWRAITKAKEYYTSCMNTSLVEEKNLTDIKKTVNELGEWPVTSSKWDASSFDVLKSLIKIRQFTNSPPVFDSFVYIDSKNPDKRIIYVDQPELGMPSRELYLRGRAHKVLLAYQTFATEVAKEFGAEQKRAEDNMRQMVDFEIKLANISMKQELRRNETALYNLENITEMQTKYKEIQWLTYFNGIMKINNVDITLKLSEPIVNRNPSYFEQLMVILQNTPKRTIANYILWRYIQNFVMVLPTRIQDLFKQYRKVLTGSSTLPTRWRTCVSNSNSNFGLAVGNLFVNKYFGIESKCDLEIMIRNLRFAMKKIISENDWMDDKTKEVAKEKADYIGSRIGYPEKVMLESKLNEEYKLLLGLFLLTLALQVITNKTELYNNTLSILRAATNRNLRRLREPVDKNEWSLAPAVVNAFYNARKNHIVFPAGILQPPFYSFKYPQYLNYGAIGMVIGHEITHGFDDAGRKFDKNGKFDQWWTQTSVENFKTKAKCIEYQYGNFTVQEANMKLNGKLTLGENIADNGGIKESFIAYRKLVADKFRGEEEKVLPALNLNPNQLFFLNYAQIWCSIIRPEEAVRRVLSGFHSNARSRIIGPLQNFDKFADAYQCKQGSRMNPKKKCSVW